MTVRLRNAGLSRAGRSAAVRRRRSVRRSTPLLSPVRAAAAFVMLICLGLGYSVTTSSAFAFHRLDLRLTGNEPAITTEEQVRAQLGLVSASPNLFGVATDRLEASLRSIPAVESATVAAGLPGTLRILIAERRPILAWQTPGHRFLVDSDGLILADAGPADGPATSAGSLFAKLPFIDDLRESAAGLAVGGHLDPIDRDVATRLGSLEPADVGSAAAGLRTTVDDTFGYSVVPTAESAAAPAVTATPAGASTRNPFGWTAVFGFYTPTIRPPDLIPGQVRVLRELLSGAEARIGRVILADDDSGTYVPR